MGCCGSVEVPDEIIPDPTGPSTFFFKRVSMFSTNYKVLQNDENGKLWLFLKKNGGWFSDNAYFILENFVRGGGPKKDDGQALAVCKFDTLDADAFKQSGISTHEDSDNSDGYSIDSDSDREEEYKQKCKWKLKTKSKFYLDRERTREVFTLVTKGKGKARRDIKFITNTDAEGKEFTVSSVSQKVKVKKMVYHLIPTGTDVEIPIVMHGSLQKSPDHLVWESPLFRAEIRGRGMSERPIIQTREGNPSVNCLIAFVVSMELSPEDIRNKAALRWPVVRGPNGATA